MWECCCVPKYDGVEKVLNFENDDVLEINDQSRCILSGPYFIIIYIYIYIYIHLTNRSPRETSSAYCWSKLCDVDPGWPMQALYKMRWNSSKEVSSFTFLLAFRLILSQRFSMGLQSGDLAGNTIRSMPFSSRNSSATRARWGLALSSIKTNSSPMAAAYGTTCGSNTSSGGQSTWRKWYWAYGMACKIPRLQPHRKPLG